MAKDAGYTQYAGLPGSVKTGCPHTPAYKSRFCTEHMSQAPNYNKGASSGDNEEDRDAVVELLLAKKGTRNGTYYQVKFNSNAKSNFYANSSKP